MLTPSDERELLTVLHEGMHEQPAASLDRVERSVRDLLPGLLLPG